MHRTWKTIYRQQLSVYIVRSANTNIDLWQAPCLVVMKLLFMENFRYIYCFCCKKNINKCTLVKAKDISSTSTQHIQSLSKTVHCEITCLASSSLTNIEGYKIDLKHLNNAECKSIQQLWIRASAKWLRVSLDCLLLLKSFPPSLLTWLLSPVYKNTAKTRSRLQSPVCSMLVYAVRSLDLANS